MGKFDAHKNFGLSTVLTAPSPATSGTSLVVAGGGGLLFPAVPFNAVIWPTGAKPTAANAEIVRVTNIATDTFTIVRTQESSNNRTVIVGDQIMDAGTAKVFTDIEALWGFYALSATDMDEILPASTDLAYSETLEIGATVSLELPATSTLEIVVYAPTVAGNPVGSITMFAGPTAPAGYLLCQGQAVLRATFRELFLTIGTSYGAGDGSTTFNLPDLRGRSPMGAGTGTATGATAKSLGSQPTSGAGGEETHTLTGAESGTSAHSHAITDPGHTHAYASTRGNAFGPNPGNLLDPTLGNGNTTVSNTTGITINNSVAASASNAHNILDPVSVVNFIIKT